MFQRTWVIQTLSPQRGRGPAFAPAHYPPIAIRRYRTESTEERRPEAVFLPVESLRRSSYAPAERFNVNFVPLSRLMFCPAASSDPAEFASFLSPSVDISSRPVIDVSPLSQTTRTRALLLRRKLIRSSPSQRKQGICEGMKILLLKARQNCLCQ